MKATELMIGDWVMYNPNVFNEDEYERYREPYPYRIKTGECIDDAVNGCYEPIPLSDRILLKNGFQYFHKNYASLSYDHPFQIQMLEWPGEDGIGIWMVCGLKIRYVHELQHVLRMAEIDVKIRVEDCL